MEITLSIIAIVFSVASGVFALYTFIWTMRRDCKQATLEAYNRLQSEVFDRLNLIRPDEIPEICTDRRSAKYKELSGYLARIEHFCVGLNEGIYDKPVFYSLAHGYFDGPQIKNRIEPVIKMKNSAGITSEVYYDDILQIWAWMEKHAGK